MERGTLPRIRLDEARTALNVADNGLRAKTAERAVVQQQFNEGQVLAPAAGRMLKKLIAVGSVVLPGDPVAMIAQQNFKLRLRVPERHARFLKAGDRIRVDGAEFGDHSPKSGVIDLVYPQIEDGRVIADATVENLGEYFVGDRLRVWISGGDRKAFVIPSDYVTTRYGIDYVQIRQADRTVSAPVQRGRPSGQPRYAQWSRNPVRHSSRRQAGAAVNLGLSGRLTRATIGSPLTPLFLLASLVVGLIAVVVIPREEEPQISVPMVDIRINADGLRGPDAVELVTKPLEIDRQGHRWRGARLQPDQAAASWSPRAFWSEPSPRTPSSAFTRKSAPISTASRSAFPNP